MIDGIERNIKKKRKKEKRKKKEKSRLRRESETGCCLAATRHRVTSRLNFASGTNCATAEDGKQKKAERDLGSPRWKNSRVYWHFE